MLLKKVLLKTLVLTTLVGSFSSAVLAKEPAVSEQELAQVKKAIAQNVPPFLLKSVKASPVAGLFEVVEGNNVVYYSKDGKFKFVGDLLEPQARVNHTQNARNVLFKAKFEQVFASVDKDSFIKFPAKGDKKGHLNVFTDVDCVFCRKLHKEVPELTDMGVEVRYYLYPRAGINSHTAQVLESVWCADDQQDAMNKAKLGKKIPTRSCDNPIEKHIALATDLGLRGTPFIITDSGQRIGGYAPAKQLFETVVKSK